MSGKEKDLPHAKTATDPNLTFDYNDLLAELARELTLPERQPGDVDVFMLVSATGKSESRCRDILKRKVAEGELKAVKVQGEHGMPIMVYRKA